MKTEEFEEFIEINGTEYLEIPVCQNKIWDGEERHKAGIFLNSDFWVFLPVRKSRGKMKLLLLVAWDSFRWIFQNLLESYRAESYVDLIKNMLNSK